MDSTLSHPLSQPEPDSGDPLGTIAKIASTVSQSRKMRFYLQSLARRLLPAERVAKCLRDIAPYRAGHGVDVMYSPQRQNARYRNLIVCGRLWFCPVCAARITEGRRRELSLALAASPYKTVLVTYTLRHSQQDKLTVLLDTLLKAYHNLKSGRAWVALKDEYSWVGSVRSLEVTDGTKAFHNGWHVHIHELVFLDASVDPAWLPSLGTHLKRRWSAVLAKLGFDASYERGVVLQVADEHVREYVAKYGHDPIDGGWTVEHELIKSASKVGKDEKHGRTAFQLLKDYGDGDLQAGALFREYAAAFKGRNQLVWSRGLRALLGLGVEAPDEALAVAPLDDDEFVLVNLAPAQWRVILGLDLRAELLDLAASGDEEKVWAWLESQGVPYVETVNLTEYMWSEYERIYGGRRNAEN